jgi:PilZ domain/RDD family
MDAGTSTERQVRAQHRHELRTLTYLTLEQANGGIVRNLNQNGVGAQMVAAVPPRQHVRIRFELRHPRLRVETRGEVVWSTFSGQCGIRFLDLPAEIRRHINEWIFGDLLEGISLHAERTGAMFGAPTFDTPGPEEVEPPFNRSVEEDDGLLISGPAPKVISLPVRLQTAEHVVNPVPDTFGNLDWLSQPLSPRALAWTIDVLMVTAALLMFALVFLSITGDVPASPWVMAVCSVVLVAMLYWGFFWVLGGKSFGRRLARLVGGAEDDSG